MADQMTLGEHQQALMGALKAAEHNPSGDTYEALALAYTAFASAPGLGLWEQKLLLRGAANAYEEADRLDATPAP